MFRVAALVVLVVLIVAGAWFGRPDQGFLARQWLTSRAESALKAVAAEAPHGEGAAVALVIEPPHEELAAAVRQRARVAGGRWVEPGTPGAHVLRMEASSGPHTATVRYRIDDGTWTVRRVGWYSVLPPLLAITAAIILRRVILCLALGILAGGIIAVWPTDHTVVGGAWYAFHQYLIRHSLFDQFRIEILVFILLISATVGIAQQSGGIQAMIEIIMRFCRTPRAARVGTVLGGVMVFFDDYLNCIIVGNSFRPLTDRFRISREKLAYLVDSTAAPVAGLALVSTWIAFEVSQIGEGLHAAGLSVEPFSVFIRSLPYRFYCMMALVTVFAVALSGRDFGPMLAAERRARRRPPEPASEPDAAVGGSGGKARYAVIPIGLTMIAVFIGLWWTAQPGPGESPIVAQGQTGFARAVDYLQQILARTNSARAFARSAVFGYLLAVLMVVGRRMTLREVILTSLRSCRVIATAVIILFLAWGIGGACRDVGTADYLVALFRQVLSPVGFSLVVFALACLISFATGSSYSTMAILLPNVVPLALAVGETSPLTGMGLVFISVGAVLEGAIFGDHCSPISDTTILSAIASQCELMDHVRTQVPYAVMAMLVASSVGYLPVALGASPAVCLLVGVCVLLGVVRLLGRRSDQPGEFERQRHRDTENAGLALGREVHS